MSIEDDIRCSKCCTRAGIAVLVLSALALCTLGPLEKNRSLAELLRYVSIRIEMKEALDQLGADKVWNHLRNETGESPETWTVASLLDYKSRSYYPENLADLQKEKKTEPQKNKTETKIKIQSSQKAPAAPQQLRIVTEENILPIHTVAGLLAKLTEFDVLDRARTYSYRYNFSIYAWQMLWYRIQKESSLSTATRKYPKTVSPWIYSTVYALTLQKLKNVVEYNAPTINDLESIYKEQASITIPSIGMPIGLLPATLFLEIGLLLSLFYFWIWFKEGARSDNFPAPGTLFGALATSPLSRAIFLMLIVTAPVSSLLLAIKSYWSKPENAVVAALVIAFSCVVLRDTRTFIFGAPFPLTKSVMKKLLQKTPFSRQTGEMVDGETDQDRPRGNHT